MTHEIVLIILIVASFATHSFHEGLIHVAKYSLYDEAPFAGAVYGNATSIVSRLSFTVGATLLALFIEATDGNSLHVTLISIALLTTSCGVTLGLLYTKIEVGRLPAQFSIESFAKLLIGAVLTIDRRSGISRRGLDLAPLAFLNVSAFVFVYVLASAFPEYRLTIVSFSPVVSMIGTVFITIVLEPRIANDLALNIITSDSARRLVLQIRVFGYLIAIALLTAIYIFGAV